MFNICSLATAKKSEIPLFSLVAFVHTAILPPLPRPMAAAEPTSRRGSAIVFDPATLTLTTEKVQRLESELLKDNDVRIPSKLLI